MTAAHTSTTFERRVRTQPAGPPACLRLQWSVAPGALGRGGRKPLMLELELHSNKPARVTLDGQPCEPASAWARAWDGTVAIRRMSAGPGAGLLIVDASPLAVAVLGGEGRARPLHASCDLPGALGLKGGRYELAGGELET